LLAVSRADAVNLCLRVRHLSWTLIWLAAALPSGAAGITEQFTTEPAGRGWQTFGDASLFHWNATDQNLEVTWDSARTNSLFWRPLSTVLSRVDSFSLAFDLRLRDIAIGVDPKKLYTFPIAIGLCRFSSITNRNFFRGAGVNATYGPLNLVEFDYFPAFSKFSPTIAQVVISTNRQWYYNHENLREMPPGELFQVSMEFYNRILTTTVKRNGEMYGDPQIINLQSAGTDFRVDTFAICSYSDAGQSPPQFSGSILAHGVVDNITLLVPDRQPMVVSGARTETSFRVGFNGTSNWLYRLEATAGLGEWRVTAQGMASSNGPMFLEDTNPASGHSFYRLLSDLP
jgi:hypothetical protein